MCHAVERFQFLPDGQHRPVAGPEQSPEALEFDIVFHRGLQRLMPKNNVQNPVVDDTRQQGGEAVASIMDADVWEGGALEQRQKVAFPHIIGVHFRACRRLK